VLWLFSGAVGKERLQTKSNSILKTKYIIALRAALGCWLFNIMTDYVTVCVSGCLHKQLEKQCEAHT